MQTRSGPRAHKAESPACCNYPNERLVIHDEGRNRGMIGEMLNQYRITANIGAGGMGEVFRARDTRLNRDVAIKVLLKNFVSDASTKRKQSLAMKCFSSIKFQFGIGLWLVLTAAGAAAGDF